MSNAARFQGGLKWSGIIAGTLVGVAALAAEFGPPVVGCKVKGNISIETGERIYHVPGQEYYAVTRIDLWKGERWFCSEEAARAAGWRKARTFESGRKGSALIG